MKKVNKKISTAKIEAFRKHNPKLWIEGLDEPACREIKEMVKSKLGSYLFSIWYWPKGKSYVINSTLDGVCFCISKSYYDSL